MLQTLVLSFRVLLYVAQAHGLKMVCLPVFLSPQAPSPQVLGPMSYLSPVFRIQSSAWCVLVINKYLLNDDQEHLDLQDMQHRIKFK